jgi:hypothetical protein
MRFRIKQYFKQIINNKLIKNLSKLVIKIWSNKDKYIIISMLFLTVFLLIIFYKFHLLDNNNIRQLLRNTIQFSGIFSAIIISYVIGKVLQSRQERMERRKEIVILSNKLTDFRRIARILVQNYGFWDDKMTRKVAHEYKDINSFNLRLWDYDNQEKKYPPILIETRSKFLKDEEIPGAYMYLDMKTLVMDRHLPMQLDLYDDQDYNITYPFNLVEKWALAHSGNNLWYCLDHKWNSYKDCFNFRAFREYEKESIIKLAKKIDNNKYSNSEFNKDLLADIGGEMASFYIPKLYELMFNNLRPLSTTLTFLVNILFLVLFSGVLIPLILSSIEVSFNLLLIVTNLSVGILCLSLVFFLLKFKSILNEELKVE